MTTATNRIIKSAHTPGPWNDDDKFIVAPDPRGKHPDIYIAEIVEMDSEGRLAPKRQREANGRLIALAPEMYEELLSLRECCLEALRGDWNREDAGFLAMLNAIDVILRKAAGR